MERISHPGTRDTPKLSTAHPFYNGVRKMVIDVSGAFRQLFDCWFPTELNAAMGVMTPQERVDMIAWVNAHVLDEAKKTQAGMNVTKALRLFVPNHPDWTETPLLPLYD
jgi:hypothetical protein